MNERVETGKVQIGDDWPGVFIRGDNAFGYALSIRTVLAEEGGKAEVARAVLSGLAYTLEKANAHNGVEPVLLGAPRLREAALQALAAIDAALPLTAQPTASQAFALQRAREALRQALGEGHAEG